MSDWGTVVFLYDYEWDFKWEFWKEDGETVRETTRGIIVKHYKYSGISGIVQHAYYGMRYFMERFDHSGLDLSDYRRGRSSSLPEIKTAFDVFMDQGIIELGYDSVEYVIKNWGRNKKRYEEKPSELKYDLFAGDGTDGYFYIYFSGKPETGYSLKYTYVLGNDLHDIQHAFKNACGGEYNYKNNKDEIDKAIKFFEEKGILITSEKDVKFIENRGATIVQQAMERN
ncbi:hypothetical protein SAMN02910384_02093 [Pseudobutyrivibrio sp. ACV-2]|uniref:hypothetical protein n=1 Tax=Pseudobutyrivibrio sp. ACV-2 TaxID=1520801 RepID=UPI00089967F6|nr:hypothetical protein [Pseudobutyrivibrio sp. ACV-2]SEA70228.1 hypothetical protein SAMN02910384_02093 [Pseudobutyrivibrio sp. ACV-2]